MTYQIYEQINNDRRLINHHKLEINLKKTLFKLTMDILRFELKKLRKNARK